MLRQNHWILHKNQGLQWSQSPHDLAKSTLTIPTSSISPLCPPPTLPKKIYDNMILSKVKKHSKCQSCSFFHRTLQFILMINKNVIKSIVEGFMIVRRHHLHGVPCTYSLRQRISAEKTPNKIGTYLLCNFV